MSLTRKILLNASVLGIGRIAMTAIGLVSVGISARYLGLDSWGSFAAATGFVGLLQAFTDMGLSTIGAREIAKRPHDTRQIMSSLLTVGIVVSVVGSAMGLGVMLLLYPGAGDMQVREGILLLMATVPLSAPFGAAAAYFVAQQKAYIPALASLSASVVTVAYVALAVAFDRGFDAVVLAYVLGAGWQAVLLIAVGSRAFPPRLSFDLKLGRQLLMWALPLGATAIAHIVYWRLDLVVLSLLKPKSEVALYGVSGRVVDALVGLPTLLMITLLPEFARMTGARERFDEITQKAFSVMALAAVGLVVFFVVFATDIVRLLGGGAFEGAASVLRILVVAVALMYLGAVFAEPFIARNKQRQLLLVAVALLPLNLGLNLALIPTWGANGAAVAWVLSELVGLIAVGALYRRFGTLPRPNHVPGILIAASAATAVGLLTALITSGDGHELVALTVGGSLTLTVYVLALYALRAVPREVHDNVVLPIWARLKPR